MIENYQKQINQIIKLLRVNILKYKEKVSIDYYKPEIVKSGVKRFQGFKSYIDTASIEGVNNIIGNQKISYVKKPSRANMTIGPNTLWFAKMKNSYKILAVTDKDLDLIDNCVLSTGFLGVKCKKEFPLSLAFSIFISDSFSRERDNNSVGTTMMGINNNTFLNIKVPRLSKQEILLFDAKYNIYLERLSSLRQKKECLQKLKQILLNKYF